MIVLTSDAVVASSEALGAAAEPPRRSSAVAGRWDSEFGLCGRKFCVVQCEAAFAGVVRAGNCGVVHVGAAAKAASARTKAHLEVESRVL
ncbi:MAG: hypothetical protein CBD47_07985 [Synechococcus sp. TMED187]|nr:MAG: hypothetical protein CBD47_07985 [Synechococcus sp. TMED187]